MALILETVTQTPLGFDALEVGDIIRFGNYDWRVLSVYEDDTALIITENVIDKRPFHSVWEDVTWETSDIRAYLNSTFLDAFTPGEQRRILRSDLHTPDNIGFLTRGGNDTTDYVFLLSIEEVVKYFGGLGQPIPFNPGAYCRVIYTKISDEYNSARVAFDEDGVAYLWLLRSSGFDYDFTSFVELDGVINLSGGMVGGGSGGVRPALLLNIAS